MTTTQHISPRKEIAKTGSFVSVPNAFKGLEEELKCCAKVECYTEVKDEALTTETSSHSTNLETVFSFDRLLIDFGALDPSSLEVQKIAKDSERLKDFIFEWSEDIQKIVELLHSNPSISDLNKVSEIAQEMGLTKEDEPEMACLLDTIVLIGGALLLAGCTCGLHDKATANPGDVPIPGAGGGGDGE